MNSIRHLHLRLAAFVAVSIALLGLTVSAATNPIVEENAKPGNPRSDWDAYPGDTSIQGFTTQIGVNKGETVQFKINTDATSYEIRIYRVGYYQGNGARYITTINPSVPLPQVQPQPLSDPDTGLIDCGNWAVSASWTVPTDVVSGLYIAVLQRHDTHASSNVLFVVRDDSRTSDILFQTSDTTWQAYNRWGGNSLYAGNPIGRAYKVSYNRPLTVRTDIPWDSLFVAEYPMIRWLEKNGYDVSYITGVDTDRAGSLLLNHKAFFSVGHDEYWSPAQRANVEAARAAGVHLAFFSGNEVFWKIRWENSTDASGTPYRTMVCYKDTHANAQVDPTGVWTGTWRDPRFSPPADGGRPENALTGTSFIVNAVALDPMTVPSAYGAHRFWRGTSVNSLPADQSANFNAGLLGFEWDEIPDNGFQPAGQLRLSLTTINSPSVLQDYGSNYAAGLATHSLSLYRASSGALVFGAGTCLWSWGLDDVHDNPQPVGVADTRLQQATVNLLADMGAQPATLQSGLSVAVGTTDTTRPVSVISFPAAGANLPAGVPITVTGTASDVGGLVWGVEVSVDGGVSWQPATGRQNWTFTWSPSVTGPVTLKSRAVDDSANLETPSAGVTVTVPTGQKTIWAASAVPVLADAGPDDPAELGVKFTSDVAGTITGIRFYKARANKGVHRANLWSSTGTLLATATYSGETATGWQQINFPAPVSIAANTVYVASYHSDVGHFAMDLEYFATHATDNAPLHALLDNGGAGPNGVFAYGSTSTFPTSTFDRANYWVDVAFQAAPPPTLTSIAVSPTPVTLQTNATQQFTATGTYSNSSTQDITSQVVWSSSNSAKVSVNTAGLAMAQAPGSANITATSGSISGSASVTVSSTTASITTTTLSDGQPSAAYSAALQGVGGSLPYTWSVTSGALPTGLTLNASTGVISGTPTTLGTYNFTAKLTDSSNPVQTATKALSILIAPPPAVVTLWTSSDSPAVADGGADNPVEVGVRFTSSISGKVSGVRFYKSAANTGTHIGSLWTNEGTLLASATFASETASGWQQVNFSTPVTILANTPYIISYHTNVGHYSYTSAYFATNSRSNPPLDAAAGANGVFGYGAGSTFPNQTFNSTNYWVDVVFQTPQAPTLSSIQVTPANSSISTGTTQQFTATGTYSDGSTQNLTTQVTWASSDTSKATINSSGLATAIAAGPTTISATSGSKVGSTTLTVQSTPVSITTTALPTASKSVAYSAALAGSGGTTPYTWSIAAGSLPTGLTLNAATGVISGTPTVASTYNFTVKLADSTVPAQSTTKALSIVVSALPAPLSIWSSSVVPAIVDAGADSSVELGVKFRSDVGGTITGIRFYKSAANTGTHTGSLWSSSGTLLATATFSGETASGWQQVTFSSPVAITANTVYVASYHVTAGHYSANNAYFASAGADNAPLHALANNVSGPNGVFAYGASTIFPNQSYNTSNYWVDVLFQPATLSSISVTPASATVTTGNTQQYTATGTYSDATTQNITSQVTWASSATSKATINSSGLLSAIASGSSTISATLGSVSGSTPVTIQTGALTITTSSLPGGAISSAYSATVTGTGGTLPYHWSLASGTLPNGLALNANTGAITGTPTTSGTSSFTIRLTDSAAFPVTTTKALSIVIAATPAPKTIWSNSTIPAIVDAGADSPVELGVKFRSDTAGKITGIRFYKSSANTGTHIAHLWSSTGTLLATATFSSETASGWQQVTFTTPVTITANTVYVASYHVNGGHYSANSAYFATSGADAAPLHALASGVSGSNGVYAYGSSSAFPNQSYNNTNYWVDVLYTP
ncbi:MAG TPA: DUF4082 domain-containing protein [Opitutaceae bacterium]|nr:DUF4082 domain-containing protein [Opitutaceae bacterium]